MRRVVWLPGRGLRLKERAVWPIVSSVGPLGRTLRSPGRDMMPAERCKGPLAMAVRSPGRLFGQMMRRNVILY